MVVRMIVRMVASRSHVEESGGLVWPSVTAPGTMPPPGIEMRALNTAQSTPPLVGYWDPSGWEDPQVSVLTPAWSLSFKLTLTKHQTYN